MIPYQTLNSEFFLILVNRFNELTFPHNMFILYTAGVTCTLLSVAIAASDVEEAGATVF